MSSQVFRGDHENDGRQMRSVRDPGRDAGGGSANFRTVMASPGQQDRELSDLERARQIELLEAEADRLQGSLNSLRATIAKLRGEAPADDSDKDASAHRFG